MNYLSWPWLALAGLGSLIIVGGMAANVALFVWLVVAQPSWRQMSGRMSARPWTWREAGSITMVLVLLHLILLTAISIWHGIGSGESAGFISATVLAQTAIFHGGGCWLIAHAIARRGISWRTAFGLDPKRIWRDMSKGVLFYFAAMPFVILAALFYRLLLFLLDYEFEPQAIIELFVAPEYPLWLKVYLVLIAVAVAPVVEEMLFRGVALSFLSKHMRPILGIAAVSVAFAAIHFNLAALVPLCVIASAFSVAYVLTGSLLVPITMHVCFNSVSLIILFIASALPESPF